MKRKSIYFFVLLGMLWATLSHAQTTSMDSLSARYDSLEPYVQSGKLLDRNPAWIIAAASDNNPLKFHPDSSHILTKLQFENLYRTFYYSEYSNTHLSIPPDRLQYVADSSFYGQVVDPTNTQAVLSKQGKGDISLSLIHFEYEHLTTEAIDSGLVVWDENAEKFKLRAGNVHINDTVFLDTVNFSTSANNIIVVDTTIYIDPNQAVSRSFKTQTVLGAAPLLGDYACIESLNQAVRFYVDSLTSFLGAVQFDYYLDFDDGSGFVPISPGQVYDVTYSSYGQKNIRMSWGSSNATQAELNENYKKVAEINVVLCKLGNADQKLVNVDFNPCQVPMDEGVGKITGWIKYSHAGNKKLNKPLIVVEGLETGKPADNGEYDLGDEWGFGDLNWRAFSSGNFGDIAPQLAMFPDFMDSLRRDGYDIIIIDIHSNRSIIQKNANALIHLIQAVNDSLSHNGSDEEIVVIGASMGGLIARYALRKMEQAGCCHNTRVYMTFSTPHRGANIPLGVQHFLYNLGYTQNILGRGDQAKTLYDKVLNSPVARQMLVYHREGSARSERLAFQAEIDSMGQPQHCRRLAMTNGSGQGIGHRMDAENNQGAFMQPTDLLVDIDFKVKVPLFTPDPTAPYLTLNSLIWNNSSNGNFSLMDAHAYAVDDSPNHASSATVYKRGRSINQNLKSLATHMGLYELGMRRMLNTAKIHLLAYNLNLATSLCASCGFITNSQSYWTGYNFLLNSSLLQVHNLWHFNRNFPSPIVETAAYPSLPYDNAPGDYNNTQKRMADLGEGLVTAYFPNHTFIATVSAIDLDTSDLFVSVEDLIDNNKELLQFEDIWFNKAINQETSVNQRHVKITPSNLAWVVQKLRETQGPLGTAGNDGTAIPLSVPYNYGLPNGSTVAPEQFIKSTTIESGGDLQVNQNYKVGYINSPYNAPKSLTHFEISTTNPNCGGSHVIVEDNGVFTIGDNNYTPPTDESNTADVFFLENSILEIETGGTLRIHNRSRLVIEEGARIIIHPGAIIDLDGDEAVLEIAGTTQIKPNAQFTFQGDGFVRFAQDMNSVAHSNSFWSVGANSAIAFSGSDTTDKRLEVVHGCYIPHLGIDSVAFKNMRVELAEGAKLHVLGNWVSHTVCYAPLGGTANHQGVWTYGRPNVNIDYSYFYGGETGLGALLTYGGNNLELDYCKFHGQSQSGLYTEGQGVNINYSGFYDSRIGWEAVNMTNECNLIESQFIENTFEGAYFIGQSAVSLFVEKCLFELSTVGIHTVNTDMRMVCTRSIDNVTGVLSEEGYLDLGNVGRNTITHNDVGVHMIDGFELKVKDGENHFFGNQNYFIYGNLTGGHLHGNSAQLDLANNNFPSNSGGTVPIALDDHQGNPVSLINFTGTGLYYTWPCYVVPTSLNEIVLEYPSLKVINTTNYTNYYFSDALFDAIGKISYDEYIGDDLTAISALSEILEYDLGEDLGENEIYLKDYGFRMMMKALTNAYEQELIPLNRAVDNQPESPYLQMVIDEIDERITGINAASATAYEEEFQLTLSKAHMFRLSEHYDYALNILQNSGNWASGDDLFETEYWRCVCEAEENLLDRVIDAEQYLEEKSICQSTLQAKRAYREIELGLTSPVSYKAGYDLGVIESIHPNPTTSFIEVELMESEGKITAELRSMEGVLLISKELSEKQSKFRLDLSELPSGSYLLHIRQVDQLKGVTKVIRQ